MASALGVGEEPGRPLLDTLADAVSPRRLLLVLDNCEHLIDACAAVCQRLLDASPGLIMITTSREPLRVAAETVWPVHPLSVAPDGAAAAPGDAIRYEAIRLFAARAAASLPEFAVGPANAAAVAALSAFGVFRLIRHLPARVRARQLSGTVEELVDLADDVDPERDHIRGSETAIFHNRTTACKHLWVVRCVGIQALSGAEPFQLVAGATGTGKTKTLQILAGELSKAGVPVFVSDVKGDLTGISRPGDATAAPVVERVAQLGVPYTPTAHPVELLSLSGALGAPVRATLSSFGPLLLGKVLDLPADQRVEATLATTALAVQARVDIVRVHDVRENVRAARMADAIIRSAAPSAAEGGER